MKDIDHKDHNAKKKGPLQKWRSMDPAKRDRLSTMAITAAVVTVLGIYVIATMLPGGSGGPDPVPGQTQSGPDAGATQAGQEPGGPVEGSYGSGQDPLDGPGETASDPSPAGVPETDKDGYAYTGGQKMYVANLDGERLFEFNIPMGFMTRNSNNSTWLKPEGMDLSVQSSIPFRFSWSRPSGTDTLLESGRCDFLSGGPVDGVLEKSITAVGYYESKMLDGTVFPVVLARSVTRYDPADEFAGEDIDEYLIIADVGEGMCFTGRVEYACLSEMFSQRYPDLDALARAMIPPSSEPGMPQAWTGTNEDQQAVEAPPSDEGTSGDAEGAGTDNDTEQ